MAKKKKSDDLTPRQRQSQRIMREKVARKRRQELVLRAQIAGMVVGAALVLGGGAWLWVSGAAARIADNTVTGLYRLTAQAGFGIDAIYLEGRNRTAMADINQALGLAKGQSIFKADLDGMRTRLESIASVRQAAVERALPHTLYVRIIEREPVALWQNGGKLTLVDDSGVVMRDLDTEPYMHLPLVIGEGAPKHVAELLTLLASEPELAKKFAAGIYTGGRRWNIRLDNGTEIKLPEQNPQAAWKALADLQEKQQLLNRAVKVVDLRLAGRLFITLMPQDMPKRAAAKET